MSDSFKTIRYAFSKAKKVKNSFSKEGNEEREARRYSQSGAYYPSAPITASSTVEGDEYAKYCAKYGVEGSGWKGTFDRLRSEKMSGPNGPYESMILEVYENTAFGYPTASQAFWVVVMWGLYGPELTPKIYELLHKKVVGDVCEPFPEDLVQKAYDRVIKGKKF